MSKVERPVGAGERLHRFNTKLKRHRFDGIVLRLRGGLQACFERVLQGADPPPTSAEHPPSHSRPAPGARGTLLNAGPRSGQNYTQTL